MEKKQILQSLQNKVKMDLFRQLSTDEIIQQPSPQILNHWQSSSHGELVVESNIANIQKQHNFQNHYEMGKILGEGAHAVVRQCWLIQNPEQIFAVKITRSGDPEIVNTMKQTFLNTLKLNHPLICKTYKLYIDANKECSYLVLEYLPFPSVHQLLAKDILNREDKLLILKQCFEAIQYLHTMGICHRDLKPDNILFDQKSGTIKIIDFGVSKRFIKIKQKNITFQRMWTITGNMLYQAPELFTDWGYNELIDIWAIGVIAFEMFCQRLPITQENRLEFFDQDSQMPYFHFPQFLKLDALSQDLLKRLLQRIPIKRISASQALLHPLFYKDNQNQQKIEILDQIYIKDDLILNKSPSFNSNKAIKYLQQSQQNLQHIFVHDFKNHCFIDAIHKVEKDSSQQLQYRQIQFQNSINSCTHSISTKTDEIKEFFNTIQRCDSSTSLDFVDETQQNKKQQSYCELSISEIEENDSFLKIQRNFNINC